MTGTVVVRLDDGANGTPTVIARLAPDLPVLTVTATAPAPLDTARVVAVDAESMVWSGGGPPTGGAGGVLSGSYPNPGFAVNMATQAELDTHLADTTPHPAYDDMPSLVVLLENRLV